MKINQMAGALNNSIMPIATGKNSVVAEDLTNIVDVGKVVLDYTASNPENFNTYTKGLIDQIGKVVFWDRTYSSVAPSILVESWEYGSILAKTRCKVLPDFEESPTYKLREIVNDAAASTPKKTPGIKDYPILDPFELNLPEAEVKFYNKKNVFDLPITIGRKQLEAAFRSPEEMQRFINMIENRIRMKKTIATDALIYRTIANFMGLKINAGNYIDLMASYNAATGSSLNSYDACVNNVDFQRYAVTMIDNYRSYMKEASVLFNRAGYVNFTPEDRMKFVMLKDFEGHLKSQLYSTSFNEDYVKLGGYEVINSWQGPGSTLTPTPPSVTDRAKLHVICTNGTVTKEVEATVVATLFDRDGCAVCNEDPRVTSAYNPRGEYTNFFYKWDANYLNDSVENGLVFTIGEPTTKKPGT